LISKTNMLVRKCFILVLICGNALTGLCQSGNSYPINDWAKALGDPRDTSDIIKKVTQLYEPPDSNAIDQLLLQIAQAGDKKNDFFNMNMLLLQIERNQHVYGSRQLALLTERLMPKLDAMLKIAMASGDIRLLGMANYTYARIAFSFQEMETAAFYAAKALQCFDQQKPANFNYKDYTLLAMILFQNRQYANCIHYTLQAVANLPATWETTTFFNTIGQSYYKLKLPDSAHYYFCQSLHLLDSLPGTFKTDVWKGINHTGIGLLYYDKADFDSANQFFTLAYTESKDFTRDLHPAIDAATWLGKTYLAQEQFDSARIYIDKAFQLLSAYRADLGLFKARCRENLLQAKAELYNRLGNRDSFYIYTQRYNSLHDSLERVALLSSDKIVQLRISNEADHLKLQQLSADKKQAELIRNFIIAFIILLSLTALLTINRQRQKAAHKLQFAQQQKQLAEAKMAMADAEKKAAMEQLELFTQNLIEKTRRIGQLEEQAQQHEQQAEEEQWKDQLSQQFILTDDDWLKFKTLFEKGYPGFLARLKEAASEVTAAEQRMAALSRLQLTTKQMASVLGISPNSVVKAKQRLRQRLNIPADADLEEFMAAL